MYLKTDVLLLCDVFEKFINTCLEYHSLDHPHYSSSPALSWDAMLKMTRIKLEKTMILIFICLLKRESEVVFHLFQKDTVQIKIITLLCIGMEIIYMAGL